MFPLVLVPDISLVVLNAIFVQKHSKLLLKRSRSVMLLLPVNVSAERIQIGRADRETAVAALPGKTGEVA